MYIFYKEYFAESISNPSGFRARKANSYAEFKVGITYLICKKVKVVLSFSRLIYHLVLSIHILMLKSSGGCVGAEKMMGESATSGGPNGNYYLETNGNTPYAKGQTCS